MKKFSLPDIPESEQTPLVKGLLGIIEQLANEVECLTHTVEQQKEEIAALKDEINVLKGQKKRPEFKPSKLDKSTPDDEEEESDNDAESKKKKPKKRPGSAKRSKKGNLPVDNTVKVFPDKPLPDGAIFKGYRDYLVQDLEIKSQTTLYKRAWYLLPDGTTYTAALPDGLKGHHFGVQLRSYILHQYHQCQVTQPLLLAQLREWGVDISSGQLSRILTEKHDSFHQEKDELLSKGLRSRGYVTTDDTGARHQGKNGYVTHIGNELFAWFQSTQSKSRINFLSLLHAGHAEYRINDIALDYMREYKLPSGSVLLLTNSPVIYLRNNEEWEAHLKQLGIATPRHIKIATEGALMGSLLSDESLSQLAIISDGAGQFAVLQHGLCWVHAERLIHKLIPKNETYRQEVEKVRDDIWTFYSSLKTWKKQPCEEKKKELDEKFDKIFSQEPRYMLLREQLKRLKKLKQGLLLVLERPEIPIHTNGSENDLREQVKRRKVSGGTRSDLGRQCRDTFSSLKKTCQKQKVSFWRFLIDRLSLSNLIQPLGDLVLQKSQPATAY